jgi:MFS family permease
MTSFPCAFFTRSFLNVLILMIASFSLGIGIAYPSPAIPSMLTEFALSPLEVGAFGALTSFTAVIGPFFTNPVLRAFGRRACVRFIALVFVLAWACLLFASPAHPGLLQLHRGVIGIACGGVSSVVPMYIMEISAVDLRSICGSMHQFGISFAIFFVNLIGVWLDWRALAVLFLCVSSILAVSLTWVPEPVVDSKIAQSNSPDRLCGNYLRPLLIGVAMMFFQQVSGINAVLTNLRTLLDSKYGPALAASAQCLAAVCCISLIDRLGRRVAWCISLFGSAASMFVLGLSFVHGGQTIGVLAAFAFLFFFCFGLGPIPWFLPPEMFPDRVRPLAVSILSSVNWGLSAAVIFAYPIAVRGFGQFGVLAVFAAVLASGGVFGWKVLAGKREKENGTAQAPAGFVADFSGE